MCKISAFGRDTHGDNVSIIGTFENKYNDYPEKFVKFAVLTEIE